MIKKNLFKKENFFIIFLFLFSLLINQYYGNIGVFPVDSFSHFDIGFRILLGQHPFKDYWIISGPFVDYLQSLFFYIFGINWQIYILHASLLNVLITLSTFVVLKSFKLNIFYCFIYSLLFSVLAYPSSGTPFVDHHSAFFSLLGIYSLIFAIKKEKFYYWILLPIFFIFAFLSKQVPSSYVIISTILILIYYSIVKKKYKWIQYSFLSFIICIMILLIFGKFQGIKLSDFYEQYIFYPQTIGEERFDNYNITFNSVFENYKFIYISLAPLFYINVKRVFLEKKYFQQKDFFYFLILVLFSFSLILHQMLTRNQIFIFFLIPILIAFSHISLKVTKKSILIMLLLFCLFVTTKYHLRFNEGRKFHELVNSNFLLASNASEIDGKLAGLKWITPKYKDNPSYEINLINEIKNYLQHDKRNKMLMTNYSFFSVILEEEIFSTTRWHIFDGTDYPRKKGKYFVSYKNLFANSIKRNDIKVIYTINPVRTSDVYDYIDKKCFKEKKITEMLISYEVLKCEEISG